MTQELTQREKQEVLQLITAQATHPLKWHPIAIVDDYATQFFNYHYNTFDAWFVTVRYHDGLHELWWVVNIAAGYSDDDWYLENIHTWMAS